jgi:photosystem II stability/assembly factor-like uncharacterized protein
MTYDWHHLRAYTPPTPVLAVASGPDGFWVGGLGGVAWGTDEGSWHPQIASLPLSAVTALVYADGWLIAGGSEGIARSSDGGRSWRAVEVPTASSQVVALASSPTFAEDSTILAALLDSGILRSSDAGRSWQAANFGLHCFEVTALAWGPQDVVLAATSAGIYRSPNGGRAWRLCHNTEGEAIAALAWSPDGSAFAALENGLLLRSVDVGDSWQVWGAAPEGTHSNALFVAACALWLGTDAGLLCLGREVRSQKSEVRSQKSEVGEFNTSSKEDQSPESWRCLHPTAVLCLAQVSDCLTRVEADLPHWNAATICNQQSTNLHSAPGGAGATRYIGTSEGLLVDDGCLRMLPPPPTHDLRRLQLLGTAPLLVGSQTTPAAYHPEHGWQSLTVPVYPLTLLAPGLQGNYFCAGANELFRSTDGGQCWQLVHSTAAGPIQYLSTLADGRGWAAGSTGPLLFSSDGGANWSERAWPFGVLPLAALQATPELIFAATYDGRLNTAQIWRSADAGASWQRGASAQTRWPLVATYHAPACLSLGDTLFVQQPDGDWRQTRVGNGGGVRRIVGDGQGLVVLSESGLWQTRDLGASWQRLDAAIPFTQTLDIAWDGARLYALLTGGRVVWAAGDRVTG